MKEKKVSQTKVAATYIGTVVGAGFATGQEILQFFVAFGIKGAWGIALTTLLFIVFGIMIMEMGFRLKARSHLDITGGFGGKFFGIIIDAIVVFFLYGSLTAMLAGTGALVSQQFGIPEIAGNLAMAVLATVTVLCGTNGVINAISSVVPFLLLAVTGISIYSIINMPPDFTITTGTGGLLGNWLGSSLLYASYNIIMALAVLAPLGAAAESERAVRRGGLLGGIGLGAGSLMIYLAVCGNMGEIQGLEVPMAYIAAQISPFIEIAYSVVLIAEIYTTAVGSLFGLAAGMTDIDKTPLRSKLLVVLLTLLAFLGSLLGFSNLVKYLYPLAGYAGFLLLAMIVYKRLKI